MKIQYYKALTADGRAFYFLTAAKAEGFAAKTAGRFVGVVDLSEVRALVALALKS